MYSIADTLSSRIALGVCWLTRRCRVRVKRPSASAVVVRIYSIATVDAHAKPMWHHKSVIALFHIVLRLLIDLIALTALALRQRRATAAEILVPRRQIALYKERGIKPRRIDPVTRISLALLSRFCNWRDTLVVVRPETMLRWHRAGWKLYWRLKSRPGRPPIPLEIQALIRRMANENSTWDQERIANELSLKLGIQVSPRTVNKYLPRRSPRRPRGDMRCRRSSVCMPRGSLRVISSSPSRRRFSCCTYLWGSRTAAGA